MLLERAEIMITEGTEKAFAAAMHERGLAMLKAVPGVRSVQFGRGVENPSKFMLLVEWDSLDSHTAFAKSTIYSPFAKIFVPFSKGGSMEHFEMM